MLVSSNQITKVIDQSILDGKMEIPGKNFKIFLLANNVLQKTFTENQINLKAVQLFEGF